ncbi:MAG: AAA family ATPase [Balneolaceae bacterium]
MMRDNYLQIRLERFVVTNGDFIVFDENFHSGINIIRGENGSGKTSLMRLIYFGLGGALKDWTDEMKMCDYVIAEANINSSIITLKREVNESGRTGISIFYGGYEESLESSLEGWKLFPYSMSDNKKSFSQELFDLLRYPEMRSEFMSNITIHQLLRLIYVDQLSPPDLLLTREDFDAPLTRKAIGEFLLGIDDNELYDLQLKKKEAEKLRDSLRDQVKNITSVLNEAEFDSDEYKIEAIIEEKKKRLQKVINELKKIKKKEKLEQDKNESNTIEELRNQIVPLKNNLVEKLNLYESISFDISDSELFIDNLYNKLNSLNQSEVINNEIEELEFEFCPKCLSELEKHSSGSNVCSLCKTELDPDDDRYTRIRQELKIQIEESESLLEEKIEDLAKVKREIPELRDRYTQLQSRLDEVLTEADSTREEENDELLIEQGYLESSINNLNRHLKFIGILNELKRQEQTVAGRIETLAVQIAQKNRVQNKNKKIIDKAIFENTSYLLMNDLDREEQLSNPINIEIDFFRNTFSLNGKNQFSASSMNLLKKSIILSIYFASIDNSFVRFPRFLLIDNIEDKGMESVRTKNFQRTIVDLNESNDLPTENYQLIYTTSDIPDEYEDSGYCVGEHYTHNSKTLNLPSSTI